MDRRDPAQAVEWLRMAALQGDTVCQTLLAKHYEFGDGVEQDPELSVRWYRRAAEGGEPEAKCCLGWLMEHGKWADRDPEGAVELYRQAAEAGSERGLLAPGRLSAQRRRDPGRPGAGGPLL